MLGTSLSTKHWQTRISQPEFIFPLVLLLLSLLSRLVFFGHPNSAVFDEVHFNYFTSFYFSGEYYYDIHPPLAKLLFATSTLPVGGIQADEVVRTIGTSYPTDTYLAMRLLPTLLGACLPLLLYFISRELGFGLWPAFVAGAFVLFDNALTIQSRLVLLDAMLLFFGLGSLWLFLKARTRKHLGLLLLSALFAGLCISIKWLGIAFLGLIGLTMLFDCGRQLLRGHNVLVPFLQGSAYLAICLLTYTMTFLIHFSLLGKHHEQGAPFMSIAFQSTLEGNRYYQASGIIRSVRCPQGYRHQLAAGMPNTEVSAAEALACKIDYQRVHAPGFWGKFFELNQVMYTTNQGLAAGHPDGSKWYTWPLTHKPLYYWFHEGARIYLLANPVVWWLSALAIIGMISGQFYYPHWRQDGAFWIILTGFWASLLPFTLVARVMFMYHYLTGLCFAILGMAFLLNQMKHAKGTALFLSLASAATFLLLSPVTYGLNWYGSDLLWYLRFFGWHP